MSPPSTGTSQQQALLLRLTQARGKVVPFGDLLNALYRGAGDAAVCAEGVLRVQVWRLRRKIGVDAVETVHGVGYRLVPPATGARARG